MRQTINIFDFKNACLAVDSSPPNTRTTQHSFLPCAPTPSPYRAKTAATAATTAPADPATCSAPPVKGVGDTDGIAVAIGFGFDPLGAKVLTINDGQGVDSVIMGMVRVIILSGMVVGQDVPHGALTVDYDKTVIRPLFLSVLCVSYLSSCASHSHGERREGESHDGKGLK